MTSCGRGDQYEESVREDPKIWTYVAAIEPIQPSPVVTALVMARTVSGAAFEAAQPMTMGCERWS
jgi:hypothetical protein